MALAQRHPLPLIARLTPPPSPLSQERARILNSNLEWVIDGSIHTGAAFTDHSDRDLRRALRYPPVSVLHEAPGRSVRLAVPGMAHGIRVTLRHGYLRPPVRDASTSSPIGVRYWSMKGAWTWSESSAGSVTGMSFSIADAPDQSGRTFVVTGANGGLGEVVTRTLAAKGATVVMACRNAAKAQQVADGIDGDVQVAELDLASLASVRDFAAKQGGFDVLVNNAGIMNIPMRRTVDGFETQFGVNHLGHFALTGLLLDRITDRVVTVASIAHKQTPKFWIDDLNYDNRFYQRNLAYAQSKLANLMFARELQRRLVAAARRCVPTRCIPGCRTPTCSTTTRPRSA